MAQIAIDQYLKNPRPKDADLLFAPHRGAEALPPQGAGLPSLCHRPSRYSSKFNCSASLSLFS
jgi:hypothetical protein